MAMFSQVMDREDLQGGQRNNAYIYRDPQKGGKWHLYFLIERPTKNHRFVLTRSDGGYPDPSAAGENEAMGLAQERYIDLRSRADRGEAIKVLTLGKMVRLTGYDPLRRRQEGETTYREKRKDLTCIF